MGHKRGKDELNSGQNDGADRRTGSTHLLIGLKHNMKIKCGKPNGELFGGALVGSVGQVRNCQSYLNGRPWLTRIQWVGP